MTASLADTRIGFLYNHDEIHQVAHTAPIISALRAAAPELRVDVLTSNEKQQEAVVSHLDPSIEPPAFYPLKQNGLASFIEKALGGLVPLGRIGGLSASFDLFRQYDAIIVPEVTSTLLKTRYGLSDTRLIFLPHGAGDRSISFAPEIARFDFVLLPGQKTQRRMMDAGVITPENNAVIGYPKFDAVREKEPQPIFDNDKPTVLYNPHFDPKLSSWFRFGDEVLEYFAEQDRFNLIVAPHVMLFRRKILASVEHREFKLRKAIPARFHAMPHIHIDTGSERSVDMSYTRAADIYIGDVSSQVYEFIERPRPAIFLNSHNADWRNDPNYDFWKFGPVLDDPEQLSSVMETILPPDEAYLQIQSNAFHDTFSIDAEQTSAQRAAHAIVGYLGRGVVKK